MFDTSITHSSTNCGEFKVVSYNGALDVDIEFITTGYKAKAKSSTIKSGKIKDPFYPSICLVGCFGVGNYKTSSKGKLTTAYVCWYGMIYRCYSPKDLNKKPAYRNVTVCDEWLNFQSFAKWHKDNYIKGLEIDKDIMQVGVSNKVYSPKTCLFVSRADNAIASRAKTFYFVDPLGNEVQAYNLSGFCRDNKLNRSCMSALSAGEITQYIGWTKSTSHH
jgi:hypothetical protein